MELSPDTITVVEYLEQSSEAGLRKKNDISALLELAAQKGDHRTFNQIVFTGKSVYNLYSKLKRTQSGDVAIIQKQLALSADELKILLDGIIPVDLIDIRKRFELTYFENNSGCLSNLVDLSYDLSVLKTAQSQSTNQINEQGNEL